jgi:hypothetical protein
MFMKAADLAATLGYSRRDWPYLVRRYLDGRVYRLPGSGPNGPALVLRADVDRLMDRIQAEPIGERS